MDTDNGRNASRFWRERSDSVNSASSEETSPFRGFEKEAKIVLPKFNFDEILSTPRSKSKKFRRKSRNDTSAASLVLPHLTSACFVKLAREDLEQLKQDLLENSRQNKVKTKGILIMPSLDCKICGKVYGTEKKLQNHLEKKHALVYKAEISRKTNKRVSFSDQVIVHELKEYHRCRKCTRIFEDYRSLKSHMKHEHKKRKCYICNYCSKNFVDRMFFKVHIKLHCEVCGLLLPNKRKYLLHRRGACRIVRKYTCKTCDNKFFSYMDLKDHSYDHLEDLYVCDICKSQHSSKCAISHHMLFLHSENRPIELFSSRHVGNERLYVCNFCEYSSLEKDIIDTHVSVLPDLNNRKCTGYKDYYFCDQCLRKFDTETSMLKHKWSHFLNSSDNSQVQKVRKKAPAQMKRIFKMTEKLPSLMQPKIVLERIHFKPVQKTGGGLLESLLKENNEPPKEIESINKPYLDEVKIVEPTVDIVDLTSDDKVESTIFNVPKDLPMQEVAPSGITSGLQFPSEIGVVVKKAIADPKSKNNVPEDLPMQEVAPSGINSGLQFPSEIGVVVKKAIVDPKSKKTLLSRFKCEKCHKYLSTNYCLNRHMVAVHQASDNLQCPTCEETFVWPSLLKTHKCIRMNIPEMPFDDARPEIQFDNYRNFGRGMDLMNLTASEDYMNAVDFEMPAPIVQLTEYDSDVNLNVNNVSAVNQLTNFTLPTRNKYKIVMQEVPIEF